MPAQRDRNRLRVRVLRPNLPGPWRYLGLIEMLTTARHLAQDLPRAAYPLVALVVWRTLVSERRKQRQAVLDAQREAIRRAQQIWVVRPRRKRFGIF